jgi:hypothetical protein
MKISDHHRSAMEFRSRLEDRLDALGKEPRLREDFLKEMRRFLPAVTVAESLEKPEWWSYLVQLIEDQSQLAMRFC